MLVTYNSYSSEGAYPSCACVLTSWRKGVFAQLNINKMSHQPSPVSLPKRKISVESRVRTGSDPTVYALKKSNLERVRCYVS